MVSLPCLARGLLVAADRQDDTIRLLSYLDGLGNAFTVILGITGDDFIFLPGSANRDFTPFMLEHLNRITDTITNALQHG